MALLRHAAMSELSPLCSSKADVTRLRDVCDLLDHLSDPAQHTMIGGGRASSTTWSADKIALTRSDCGAV
jgi:hypothetical protein